MNRRASSAFALAFVAQATPAAAHSTFKGMGTFYGYMFHPFVVPAHLLVLIAVGLMLSQQEPRVGAMGIRAAVTGLVVGLAFDAAAGNETLPEGGLLAAALLIGGMVSVGRPAAFTLVLFGSSLGGLLVGLDSAPGLSDKSASALAYAGLLFGVLWILTILQGYAVDLTKDWQRIGKRVVGSWIVAASLLSLTLALHKPAAPKALPIEVTTAQTP